MPEPRLIKKYPNRRLYDTTLSKYIALDDIRLLLVNGYRVKVVDAKSGEEITRTVLMQIISEQEEHGKPILSTELLERLIRIYGDPLQAFIATYLEKSLDAFMQQQMEFRKQMENLLENTPVAVFTEIAEQNLAMWRKMQEGLGGFYGVSARGSDRQDDKTKEK